MHDAFLPHARHNKPVIGIIGGLGPAASAWFHHHLVAMLRQRLELKGDAEYPEIIHISTPFDLSVTAPVGVSSMLYRPLSLLQAAQCNIVVVACNVLHSYLDHMEACLGVRPLDMIGLTADYLKGYGYRSAAVVGAASLMSSGMYEKALNRAGIKQMPYHAMQAAVDLTIDMAKSGEPGAAELLLGTLNTWKDRGAESCIIACTDLSPLGQENIEGIKVVDAMSVLAAGVVTEIERFNERARIKAARLASGESYYPLANEV